FADIAFQLAFQIVAVVPAAFRFLAGIVGEVAFALLHARAGHAVAQPIGDRSGDARFNLRAVVVAVAKVELRFEHARRTFRDDVQRAADGVAAIQRALRPAHNLDAFGEDRLAARRDGARKVDAVDIVRDAGPDAEVVRRPRHATHAEAV